MARTPASDPQRLRHLNRLLEAALALSPGERGVWLGTLSPEEQTLAPLLTAMLARAAVETDTFLRQPLGLSLGASLGALDELDAPTDQPGDDVGPYRLIRELGAGGMATVWLAERADGVLHRQVALKLPRMGLALGLAQRMARERDLLGALEHPNIARLYDAGVTEAGRPWMAMECVTGVAIDVYCRERGLDVRQRLTLFLQVADAVAHAHARLIVHRDLKPSNILVTPDGAVRLLDFGVAKLLEDEPAPAADITQLMGRAVTPDYASPEQVSGAPVTVATDVYSLGVVLYELLAGQRPYRIGRSSAVALEEAILAVEVPPASARVEGDRRLARQLRGDLDNVLAKALRKDAAHRYPSVESMAADLRRHLDGEPVLARPRSRGYRAAKFVRRHRGVLGAAAAVLTALVGGLGVALWQAREAERNAQTAYASLDQAEASFEFASAVLMEGIQADERITQKDLLQRAEKIAADSFDGGPTERAVAVDAVASWHMAMGDFAKADQLLARALPTFAPSKQDGFIHMLRCKHGHVLVRLGRQAEGIRELEAGTAAAIDDPDIAAYCLQRRAAAAGSANDADTQLRFMLEAERHSKASKRRSRVVEAQMLGDLGGALAHSGRTAEAIDKYKVALAEFDAVGRSESVPALSTRNNWAGVLLGAGDPRGALEQLERTLEANRRRSADGKPGNVIVGNRANALLTLARHQEALDGFSEMQRLASESGNDAQVARALSGQAAALARLGELGRAQGLLDEAGILLRRSTVPAAGPIGLAHRSAQALVWQLQGRLPEASGAYSALIDDFARLGFKTVAAATPRLARGDIALAQGRLDDARADALAALAIARGAQGDLPHSFATGRAWLLLAKVHQSGAELPAARDAIRNARDHLRAMVGDAHPNTLEAVRLAQALGA